MTTATSVFGMLRLVLAPGAGSELYRGLGAVVVGGLTTSAIFTLVVVPLLFSLVLDCQARAARTGGGLSVPDHGPDAEPLERKRSGRFAHRSPPLDAESTPSVPTHPGTPPCGLPSESPPHRAGR